MSLMTIVTVHCDACGEWLYTKDHPAKDRRARGWTTRNGAQSNREDYCPNCSKDPR